MVRDWVGDHFIMYLFLMLIMGIMGGIVATYLISIILAIYNLVESLFVALSGGTGG